MSIRSRIAVAERKMRERDIRQLAAHLGQSFETVARFYTAVQYLHTIDPSVQRADGSIDEDALSRLARDLRF